MATTTETIPGQGISGSQTSATQTVPAVVREPKSDPLQGASAPAPPPAAPLRTIDTAKLVAAMLKGHSQVSDLLFSPGRAPQIEVNGQLVEMKFKSLECLTPADTKQIAYDLIQGNENP